MGQAAPSDTLADLEAAAYEADQLRRFDPDSKIEQEKRATSQYLTSLGIVDCYASSKEATCGCPADKTKNCEPAPSLEDAEAMALEAMATLRSLTRSDPHNLQWRTDLAGALQVYAKALATRGHRGRPDPEGLKVCSGVQKSAT